MSMGKRKREQQGMMFVAATHLPQTCGQPHENISKRLLIHVAGFDLGLLMRRLLGVGTPRSLQDGGADLACVLLGQWRALRPLMNVPAAMMATCPAFLSATSHIATGEPESAVV